MNSMRDTIEQTVAIFRARFGDVDDIHVGWSPGRINLIGEYTDLNNGFVLPMAIDLGICVVLRHRAQPGITAFAEAYDETAKCTLVTAEYDQMPGWLHYIAGVAVLSQEKGCPLSGFDIAVHGNLPNGGGVSSSAALTTATALAMHSATEWPIEPVDRAQLCQVVEHRFAGVMCGIMDQMACGMGKASNALFIDCKSLEALSVPVDPSEAQWLIVDSGVPRSLHATEYNARRSECASAVAAIQALGYQIDSLREVDNSTVEAAQPKMPALLAKRVRHVVTENARVLAARYALEIGDLDRFGELMNESHESLRSDFEVSIDELDHIVTTANGLDGVLGARLTGAGFGGNAIVLMRPGSADHVEFTVKEQFAKRFGRAPRTHRVDKTNPAVGYPLDHQSANNNKFAEG